MNFLTKRKEWFKPRNHTWATAVSFLEALKSWMDSHPQICSKCGSFCHLFFMHCVCEEEGDVPVRTFGFPFHCRVNGLPSHAFQRAVVMLFINVLLWVGHLSHKLVLLARDMPSPLWPRRKPDNAPLGCPILIVILLEHCLFPRLSPKVSPRSALHR